MKKLLILALTLAFPFCACRAELLIYDLSFGNTGPSVNYSFLEGGYLIVDVASNAVTSIVTLTDPQTNLLYYMTGILSGTYMELISDGSSQEYGVIFSTSGAGGDADNIAFQVIGKTSDQTDIGDGNSLSISRNLRGFLLASAAESSSSSNGTITFSYGFAGSSRVTARFQSDLTKDANNRRLDAATELENLTAILVNQGVVPQPSASPSASPTASPSASPSATVSQ
ncbi:MAG: hypothetical protein ACOYM3_12365 [Terrimicrobiaceae bacterium]